MFYLFIFIFSLTSLFAEGARGSEPQSYYLQVSYTPIVTDSYFDENSKAIPSKKFTKHGLNFYGKYGLWHPDLSLILNLGFRTQKIAALGSNTGLEDASVKIDWRILASEIPLALSYETGLPLGEFKEKNELSLGDGEFDHTFRSYLSQGGWDFELGYQLRTKGYTDAWLYGIQYKHNPYPPLWLSYGFRGKNNVGSYDQSKTTHYLDFGEGIQYNGPYFGAFYSLSSHLHSVLNIGLGTPGLPQTHLMAAPYLAVGLALTF